MPRDREIRPQFCVMPTDDGPPALVIGITHACFEDMKKQAGDDYGKTLDLSSLGLPIRLALIATPTAQDFTDKAAAWAKAIGVPLLDDRSRTYGAPGDD